MLAPPADEHGSLPSASFKFDVRPQMPAQQHPDGGLLTTEPLHSMPAQRVEAAAPASAQSASYEPWPAAHAHTAQGGAGAGRWYDGQGAQAHAQNGHAGGHTQQPYAGYTPTQHHPTAVPYPTSQPSALAAYTGWQAQQQPQHAYQPYHLPPIDAPNTQPNGSYESQQPATPALPSYAPPAYPRSDSYAPYSHPHPHPYNGSHSSTPADAPPAHLASSDAYRPPPYNLSLPSIAQSLAPSYGMRPYGQPPIDHSNPAVARYGPPQPHAAPTDANAVPGPSTAMSLSHQQQRSITPLAPSAPQANAADVGSAPNGFEDGFNGSRQGQAQPGRKRKEPKDAATRKYQCTECDQKFARPSALATHIVRPGPRRLPFGRRSCPLVETATADLFLSTRKTSTLAHFSRPQLTHTKEKRAFHSCSLPRATEAGLSELTEPVLSGSSVHLRHVQSRFRSHVQPSEALSGQGEYKHLTIFVPPETRWLTLLLALLAEPRTGAIARVFARQAHRLCQRPAATTVGRLARDRRSPEQ